MNIKNIIKKLPIKNTAFWICLGFAALYMFNGIRMIDTLAYDYDGLFFHADTAEVAEDITAFRTRNHGDTNIHPLFVMFTNPPALLLQLVLEAPATVVIINTLVATLTVLCAFIFFRTIGLPMYQSVLWTIFTGSTACHLFFSSIPERHILAALSMSLLFLVAAKHPGQSRKFIWAGIMTIGVTVTNFAQCIILFFCSLFTNNNERRKSIQKTFLFGATTLAFAIMLSLIQKWIWPDTRLFFLPDGYAEETEFMVLPQTLAVFAGKFRNLITHMFVYGIIAPEPAIIAKGKLCPLMFTPGAFSTYTSIGRIAIATWAATAGAALCFLPLKPHRWLWLQAAALLCLIFNAAIHIIYGDDFFLYAVNWTFPLIALIATATVAANRFLSGRIFFNIMLTFLVAATVSSNTIFMRDFSGYFRNGNAQKWQKWQWDSWDHSREIQKFITEKNIHTLYSSDSQKWLMYALNRQVSVVNVTSEKSPSLKQSAELTPDGYAFLKNIGDVTDFIHNTMGSYSEKDLKECSLFYNIRPPFDDLVSCAQFTGSVSASCETGRAAFACDLNIDTAWTGLNLPDSPDWLEFHFSEQILVSCVKLFSRHGGYPLKWRIETRKNDSDLWQPVTPEMGSEGYFWSGPRIFWGGRQFCLEARFIPASAGSLRVVFISNDEGRKPSVSELRIYGPGDPLPSEETAMLVLLDELKAANIRTLYSERWVANTVYKHTNGGIKTLLEPYIFEHERARPQPGISQDPYPVYFSKDTAILVRAENAGATRACLTGRGYKMRESVIGPWVLFSFDPETWDNAWTGYSRLCWSSVSCFLAGSNAAAKETAEALTLKALQAASETEKLRLLERAREFYPDYQQALIHLLEAKAGHAGINAADALKSRLSFLREPEMKLPVNFHDRVRLLGITVENKTVQQGADITVRYYWKFKPEEADCYKWIAFLHFQKDGKTVFQGDHNIGVSYSYEELSCGSDEDIMMESITCKVPADAPVGPYTMHLGCYDWNTKKRLPPKAGSNITSEGKGIVIPDVITVTGQQIQK